MPAGASRSSAGEFTRIVDAYASQCVKCGQCLEKCPQHLDIPSLLESVANELEGPDLEAREAVVKQLFADTATQS